LALPLCVGNAAIGAAHDYQPNALIGDVPSPWNPNIYAYQLADVIRLVIFYNENFGIHAVDSVAVRRKKVHDWLVEE
jgi:hypothetical protein